MRTFDEKLIHHAGIWIIAWADLICAILVIVSFTALHPYFNFRLLNRIAKYEIRRRMNRLGIIPDTEE